MTPELAARLAALGIELAAEGKAYSMFTRGNCLALVQHSQAVYTGIGSSGIVTESGVAYLVWRDERPVLVGKGLELPADAAQVESLRHFSADLKAALGLA